MPPSADGARPAAAAPTAPTAASPVAAELAPTPSSMDACATRAEFIALGDGTMLFSPQSIDGPLPSVDGPASTSSFLPITWRAIDPDSRFVYWSHDPLGDDAHTELFRWSPERGVTNVGEFENLFDVEISADGNSLVGSLSDGMMVSSGFRWSLSTGQEPLDFIPFKVNGDGTVVVGLGAAGLVRWTESTGAAVIGPGLTFATLAGLASTAALDVVAWSDRTGHGFRWTEATGSKDIGTFDATAPLLLIQEIDSTGDVLAGFVGSSTSDSHAVRWTASGGFQDLGVYAGAPAPSFRHPEQVSVDGRVIVGTVSQDSTQYFHPFRWTEADGMQDLFPEGPTAFAQYLSPNGDVVIGQVGLATTHAFRWTETAGMQELDDVVWSFAVGADGDLIVGTNDQGPYMRTFGQLAGTPPELVRLAPPGLVPNGWSDTRLENVSNDAGLLMGEGVNTSGQRESWLLRLRAGCSDPQ